MPVGSSLWNLINLVNMSAYHLRKDEVQYELSIRGCSTEGDANELRKRLSQILSANMPILEVVLGGIEVVRELETCEEKLSDLSSLIDEYEGDFKDAEYKRLTARLWHYYYRLERITIPVGAEREIPDNWNELRKKSKALLDRFVPATPSGPAPEELTPKEAMGAMDKPSHDSELRTPRQSHSGQVPGGGSTDPKPTQASSSKAIESGESRNPPMVADWHSRPIPVYKWGVNFGNEPGQSIGAFLQRVEELRRARGLTEQQLFRSAVDLFTGSALIWYRSTVERITDWQELCREMKVVFQSPDYDDMLRQEIAHRMQGDQEPIDLFIAAMEGLYGRLACHVPEDQRLNQMVKNLSPYLQDKICMFTVTTIEQLRQLGRKAELGRLRSTVSGASSRYGHVLEPDLACVDPVRKKRSSSAQIASLSARTMDRKATCWNCSKEGHRHASCPEARNLFCYGCGSQGVRKPECHKCAKNL
jgi:hypothetical protein